MGMPADGGDVEPFLLHQLLDGDPHRGHRADERDLLGLARSPQISFGWTFGPAKICVAPVMTPANGTPHAFAWNIGTTWRMTSFSEIAMVSAIAAPMQ